MYPRVYVCELQTPDHFYVGTTLREPHYREREHAEGKGSKFTRLHGFKRMLFAQLVPPGTSGRLEDDLTVALMCRFGWGACRGGDRTAQDESMLRNSQAARSARRTSTASEARERAPRAAACSRQSI